jgi:hypothetical protein
MVARVWLLTRQRNAILHQRQFKKRRCGAPFGIILYVLSTTLETIVLVMLLASEITIVRRYGTYKLSHTLQHRLCTRYYECTRHVFAALTMCRTISRSIAAVAAIVATTTHCPTRDEAIDRLGLQDSSSRQWSTYRRSVQIVVGGKIVANAEGGRRSHYHVYPYCGLVVDF